MANTAHFFVDDGILKISLPFNSKFIKKFRKNTYNTFIWNKKDKVYETKFNTYALKCAVNSCSEFFEVTYCDILNPVIQYAESNKNSIFEPTLVLSNGNFYIACINEPLYNQVKNIELNNSSSTLFSCSLLAVKVHEDILNNTKKQFMASRVNNITKDMLPLSCNFLKELKIDNIVLSFRFSGKIFIEAEALKNTFKNRYFEVYEAYRMEKPDITIHPYVYIASKFERPNKYMMAALKVIVLDI